MLEGKEIIGVAPVSTEKKLVEAKEENDVWFYECRTEPLTLFAGSFMVLYPNDLHCPGVAVNSEKSNCSKVVFKVKV
jgi:YhcH/YjgK/YiaL family protein